MGYYFQFAINLLWNGIELCHVHTNNFHQIPKTIIHLRNYSTFCLTFFRGLLMHAKRCYWKIIGTSNKDQIEILLQFVFQVEYLDQLLQLKYWWEHFCRLGKLLFIQPITPWEALLIEIVTTVAFFAFFPLLFAT